MSASQNTPGSNSDSNWLDLAEPVAVVTAIGGSVLAIMLQQIAVASAASIPLALSATLGLANRRRQMGAFQDQQRMEMAHLLQQNQADFQAQLDPMKQASEGVQSQIEHLTKQDTQTVQTIATLNTQTEKLESTIASLQNNHKQGESTVITLSEQSQATQTQMDELSTQFQAMQAAIAKLQSSATDLGSQVEDQKSSAQYLAAQTEGVEELVDILREIDALTQTISANPNVATHFFERGLTRKRLQRLEDQRVAMEDFSQAIRLEPTFANAYYERGLLKSEFGHKQHAVDDLRTAAKFYFDQGDLTQYEKARELSQEIHDLIAGSPSPEEETEQFLLENLFG
ncbi:hypothetical protein HRE53_17685 [Acaryochloris sp. 'Moss Beach']|uniref:hypothetical protein n=1 Tax=Acaryochloris TaxID=155977 RepID=UPI001BB09581|nr:MULTISPECIES: hypothetical protein [Acaryochloris]QUY43570.1 hypothetical protein I1H34_05380 [Acaryochloris marina S15]UJB68371.1 hypothetical protein HRE53_17685 [Acaryochloris sp. 'Moss Beach']